jgi:hypothetical protein
MKADISKHKLDLAKEAEYLLTCIMTSFESGDLVSLGKLCNSVNVLAEFYRDNLESETAKRVPKLISYLSDKFINCVVLVLKDGTGKHFGYTANNITKFIRGESLHGASENNDPKRNALHNYVFEKDTTVECEFQINWNWIIGPNLRSSTGNLDSHGAFVHAVTLNGRRVEVSQIESTILAIVYEFWQANTNNEQTESTKTFVIFNPDWFSTSWGEELFDRVKISLEIYQKLEMPENDSTT